jgi:hypothetical protein
MSVSGLRRLKVVNKYVDSIRSVSSFSRSLVSRQSLCFRLNTTSYSSLLPSAKVTCFLISFLTGFALLKLRLSPEGTDKFVTRNSIDQFYTCHSPIDRIRFTYTRRQYTGNMVFLFCKLNIVCILLQFSSTHFRLASSQSNTIKAAMETHEVVPDVIDVAPAATITVYQPYLCC